MTKKRRTKAAPRKDRGKQPANGAGRANSKQAQLVAMLKTKGGASTDEIAKNFRWQPHTVRGAIAGALKKKLGLDVQAERIEGRGTVYRIPA